MGQVSRLQEAVAPQETLFVADAMTGQDAVRSAAAFHARLDTTGVIFTKTDGDSRGGAALSIVSTIDRPIKFVGTGEKIEPRALPSRPDGVSIPAWGTSRSSRKSSSRSTRRAEAGAKVERGEFTLEDLRDQLN
jgi:signal recognition particle subunit SRP54